MLMLMMMMAIGIEHVNDYTLIRFVIRLSSDSQVPITASKQMQGVRNYLLPTPHYIYILIASSLPGHSTQEVKGHYRLLHDYE